MKLSYRQLNMAVVQIMTALITLHAKIGNVLTLVLRIMFVLQMLSVLYPDTRQFVLVLMDTLVLQKFPVPFVSTIIEPLHMLRFYKDTKM